MDSEYEFQMVVSEVLIPFSKKTNSNDIYNGEERISFAERDPEYQKILIQEFL